MVNVIVLACLVLIPWLILMLFINSRHRKQMAAIGRLSEQLGEKRNFSAESNQEDKPDCAGCADETVQESTVAEIALLTEEKKDVSLEEKETEASAYNTGKSGKIYTKEELELLIKE